MLLVVGNLVEFHSEIAHKLLASLRLNLAETAVDIKAQIKGAHNVIKES